MVYSTNSGDPRTDETFLSKIDENYHRFLTPLENLIGMVFQMVIVVRQNVFHPIRQSSFK